MQEPVQGMGIAHKGSNHCRSKNHIGNKHKKMVKECRVKLRAQSRTASLITHRGPQAAEMVDPEDSALPRQNSFSSTPQSSVQEDSVVLRYLR